MKKPSFRDRKSDRVSNFDGASQPSHTSRDLTIAISCGAILLGLCIVLALIIPNPTAFQLLVFRVALALGAAGLAATIPGFIVLKIPIWGRGVLRAGGAIAVFVVVYRINPPALITHSENESSISEKVLQATNAGEVHLVMQSLEAKAGNLTPLEKEKIAKELAYLIANFGRDDNGNDQLREEKNHMLILFSNLSRYPFYTYFDRSAFAGMDLASCDFSGKELNSLSFDESFLINASFERASLHNVTFRRASLRGANFRNADFGTADFRDSDWFNAVDWDSDILEKLAAAGRLSACPTSMEGFVKAHDKIYERFNFEDLGSDLSTTLKTNWASYLKPGGLAERIAGK